MAPERFFQKKDLFVKKRLYKRNQKMKLAENNFKTNLSVII